MADRQIVSLRQPTLKVTFMTEEKVYNLKYDKGNSDGDLLKNLIAEVDEMSFENTDKNSKNQAKNISDAIINLATENDMSSDAGTFAITLVGTRKWDIALSPNDLVIIRINPSSVVKNDVVMVGLISEVKKIGEYSNNSTVYSITGLSMGKALMQMKLGTLQELASLSSVGWLYQLENLQENESGVKQGLSFQGATASDVVQQIITFFLLGFGNYTYGANTEGQKLLKDFIDMDLSSRGDEKLLNPTPYMAFQGSLRQFITEAQAKPFNEFYSDFTKDNTCVFKMRPTPFEKEDWQALPVTKINSASIVEQTVTKSDTDAYSIFNCSIPVDMFGTSNSFITKPQYAKELVDKYGYSLMEEDNRYIYRTTATTSSESTATALDNSGVSVASSAEVEEVRKASLAYDKSKNVTAKMLNDYIKKRRPDCVFAGHGADFIEAGIQSGLNPVYIFSHACLESDWGNKSMSYNFFGIGAFDANPQNGHTYGNNSVREGIINGAKWIAENYFKKGQKSVYSMRWNNGVHQYATDKQWDTKIATQMVSVYKAIGYFGSSENSSSDKEKVSKATTVGQLSEDEEGSKDEVIVGGDNTKDKDEVTVGGTTTKDKDKVVVTVGKEAEKKDDKKEKTEKEEKKEAEDQASSDNATRLGTYSKYLFNWYADNPSFFSGSIRVIGHPDFRVGTILKVYDPKALTTWEYYLESVSHDFSYSDGYTTVLGVTRGLKDTEDRFKHHGQSEDFLGGIFGEKTLAEQWEDAQTAEEGGEGSSGDSGDSSGGNEGSTYKVTYDTSYLGTIYAPTLGGINSEGDPTVTASGAKVENYVTIAVDPTVIPYGSVVAIKVANRPELTKLWHAQDTGGAIKGKHIDMCVDGDYAKKNSFKGSIGVAILKKGTGKEQARADSTKIASIFAELDKKYLVAPTSVGGNKVAQHAEKWRKPNKSSVYKWGGGHGDTPTDPFKKSGTLKLDCSGFTGWSLFHLGLPGWTENHARMVAHDQGNSDFFKTISKGSNGLTASEKKKILDNAKAGDFIWFGSLSRMTHIGIYMGKKDGKHYMISSAGDAGTPASGIRIDYLDSGYWLTEFNGRVRRAKF